MSNQQKQLTAMEIASLQKELREKTRDLEIESSLERVRTVAMSMNKPDEILDICKIIYNELKSLGLTDLRNTIINFWIDECDSIIDYDYSDFTGANKSTLKLSNHPVFEQFNKKIKKSKDAFAKIVVKKEQLESWKQRRREGGEYEDPRLNDIPALYYYFYSIGVGAIGISTFNALTNEKLNLLKRFRNVFDLAYRRYKDVENAESQAKEAQIQLALERVRSRSMAMHKSEELQEVVHTVFERLKDLNIDFYTAIIILFEDDSKDIIWWLKSKANQQYQQTRVPFAELSYLQDLFKARKNKIDFFSKSYSFEEKNTLFHHLFTNTELKYVPQQQQEFLFGTEYATMSISLSKHTGLHITSYSRTSFSDQDNEIFKRFAKVFDQAYTRFLDLQKAEAQAREANIETALEKVRSRSMAMYKSDELNEVVLMLFEQFTGLGISIDGININILNENRTGFDSWFTAPGFKKAVCMFTPFFDSQMMNDIVQSINNNEELLHRFYTKQEKNEYFSYLYANSDYRQLPEERKQMILAAESWRLVVGMSGNLGISIHSYTGKTFTEKDFEILIRFAKVFHQTYTRFLDLQKAEAQARESKIEASLERVRSKAMSMHSSKDLADTISLFYHELESFSITPRRCGVGLLNKETRIAELSTMNTTEQGKSIEIIGILKMEGHPVLEGVYENWLLNKEYHPVLTGNEIKEYYQLLRPQIAFPEYPNDAVQYGYFFFFPEGGVYAWTDKEMGEDELTIYRRFTSVLSLTYKRYIDLQQAEALATKAEQDLILLKEEKKRTEEALAELQVTQKQLIQSEKMASLGELTAGIAHEIQNPLNFVNNFSEVNKELLHEMNEEIEKGNLKEVKSLAQSIIENEQKINHHGKRADAIVKGMLQHSRTSSGQKEPTDINELADEYLRLAYHGLRAKDKSFNVLLKTDYDNSIGNIQIIPQDIGRVILNLITNAFYAVAEKKKQCQSELVKDYEPIVSVSTKKIGNTVEIKVADNGIGIPQKALDKIFQPFFTTKPTGLGTGLGLSLSYDIVKAHGGELKVETKENAYSEFKIILPENSK